jgi:hypothetical protein
MCSNLLDLPDHYLYAFYVVTEDIIKKVGTIPLDSILLMKQKYSKPSLCKEIAAS